jgi:hypothetical protein
VFIEFNINTELINYGETDWSFPLTQQLIEASVISPDSLTGKSWRLKIIEGDRLGSSAYYPKEALAEGAHLFAAKTKIYLNHPTADDKFNQPERRVQDIVGYLSEGATFDGKDLYANATFLPKYQQEIKDLAEAGLIGMSIRAEGEVSEADGTKTLKRFTRVSSVDVVTEAGAGGGFEALLESAQEISASESGAEPKKKEEIRMDKELEAALSALIEGVTKLTARADKEDADKATALAEAATAADKANEPVAPTAAEIAGALVEADLPKAAHAKVIAAVEAGAVLAEAITAEKDYLKEIQESAKEFKGNGSEEKLQEAAGSKIGFSLYGV